MQKTPSRGPNFVRFVRERLLRKLDVLLVPANLMLGITLRWTSIPFREEYEIPLSLRATELNRDKLRPDEPLFWIHQKKISGKCCKLL